MGALLHPVHVAEVLREQLAAVPLRTAEALVALTTFLAVGYLVVLDCDQPVGASRRRK